MPVVNYDGWWNSELSLDKSEWERHELTMLAGQIATIVNWYRVDPELIWARVKRQGVERVSSQCPHGSSCDDAECTFLHNGDDIDVTEPGDHLNPEAFTYYSLELGPALVWPDAQNNAYNPNEHQETMFLFQKR
jgi:hypothetical protein